LYNLGHEVARNTIKRTLAENGIEPAPERGKKTTWSTFLKAHMGAIAGGDFLSVEVLSPFGLIRYFVFFVIDIASRRVHIAGITNQISEAWMMQVARNLTDCDEGFLRKIRYLILDRDPNYSTKFRKLLRDSGVRPLRLPPRSPNLNAYAERFVRSIKSECLSRVIPLNERHLRQLVQEYIKHYHLERNHQGLDNRLIRDLPVNTNQREGSVRRRVRLGGMLSYYHREAA